LHPNQHKSLIDTQKHNNQPKQAWAQQPDGDQLKQQNQQPKIDELINNNHNNQRPQTFVESKLDTIKPTFQNQLTNQSKQNINQNQQQTFLHTPNQTRSFNDTRQQNNQQKQHDNKPKQNINQNQQQTFLHPNQPKSFIDTRKHNNQPKQAWAQQPDGDQLKQQNQQQNTDTPLNNHQNNQRPQTAVASAEQTTKPTFQLTNQRPDTTSIANQSDKNSLKQPLDILSANASNQSNVSINSNKDNLSVQSSTTSAIFSETDDKYQQIQISNLSADKLGFPLKPKERCTLGRDIRLFANHYGFILNKPFEILHYDINIYKVYKDKTGIEISKEVKTKDQSK
jgi:hypothetical protein